MERRGPHKSMHCKFCKPPGTVAPEKPASAQLETKTKLHLSHQLADLKVFDVFDEPGEVVEENDACICQLEGYEPCQKCAPDKKRRPKKKKVCDCPLGSRPHPNMAGLDKSNQKKKKKKDDDDEFWWEKYDREHDAMVKETWAAYLAQRKQDKRLAKCREKEGVNLTGLMKPKWYQKLSCQQTIYLEYLSTAIRLDLDENISDRTFFVLGGIGFYPRPKKKILQKCLRYCHYNTIRFLDQLSLLLKEEDPFKERVPSPIIPVENQDLYAWNDRIFMACICHLEFPNLLREIKDRLPPLPQEELPPPIQKPKYPRTSVRVYGSPYEEPLWRERMNWVEKQKSERLTRAREHLNLKRVKIPTLALVRRPSLIDARPPFLSQIEASQSFRRRRKTSKKKERLILKKKEKATFDSKVDVTAIAGVVASEVSTTPKADSEEICVFLRDKESKTESVCDEEDEVEIRGEEEQIEERPEKPAVYSRSKYDENLSTKSDSLPGEELFVDEEASDEDDVPFVTPPKTGSGATIQEPCPPPKSSPGPPASHYDMAKRELGFVNQELCVFDPNDEKSDEETTEDRSVLNMDVEDQLKQVVKKLKELSLGEEDEGEEEGKQIPTITRKKRSKKKKGKKSRKSKVKKKKKEETDEVDEAEQLTSYEQSAGDGVAMGFEPEALEEFGENEEEMNVERSSESCVCEPDKQMKVKSREKKIRKKKRRKEKKPKLVPCKKRGKEKVGLSQTVRSDLDSGKPEDGKVEAKKKLSSEVEYIEEDKIFYGNVELLLKNILRDLNDEGFISAGYAEIEEHPDIRQLIKHLQGEIVTQKTRKRLYLKTRRYWRTLEKRGPVKAATPELNISQKKYDTATWNDKNWISNLAKKKKDEFFFNIAKNRSNEAKDFYLTLFQEYFSTERFLKSYYAYMIPTEKESIMRGLR